MDLEQIKSFLAAMAASELDEMEFRQGDWSLRLVRRTSSAAIPSAKSPDANRAPAPAPRSPAIVRRRAVEQVVDTARAPLHGIVYLRPGPDTALFVTVGQVVTRGTPLCVIEAMKVFHQVVAERDGTIASVLVAGGDEVELGQDLFRYE